MKKLLVVLLTVVMLFVFAGCAPSAPSDSAEPSEAPAADFPKKSVTVICPWGAGGGTDALLRALCLAAEKELGQTIVVTNVTGGGGATGHAAIVNAKPDGYELGMITFELTTLEAQGLIPFKHTDIDPLIRVNMDAAVIAVPSKAAYSTAEEFIAYAKAHPNEINIGNPAVGGSWNIAAALLAQNTGIEIKHVPFEGTAEAVTALVGNHIQAVVASVAEVQAQVKAGELKVIGIMADQRSDALPDAKTFKEQGIDIITGTWRGLALPKDVPEAEKQILFDAFTKAMEDPEFLKFTANLGLGIAYLDSDDFTADIDTTYENVKEILDTLDINN